jgi:hypothetical protein
MISDEPDEDADNLDDDNLLTAYLDGASTRPGPDAASVLPDWPPAIMQDLALHVDAETLKWFETNHGDWRQGMCSVLRAWVDARTRGSTGVTAPPMPS